MVNSKYPVIKLLGTVTVTARSESVPVFCLWLHKSVRNPGNNAKSETFAQKQACCAG